MSAVSEEKPAQDRLAWLDALRGMAIILVLLGHAPVPPDVQALIYSFHMPLFFLLAGLFLNPDTPVLGFIRSRAERLLVPYFVFAAISYGMWLVIRSFSNQAQGIDIFTPLLGTFYGVGAGNWLTHNPPLWFLPCLFIALLMTLAVFRLARASTGLALLVCAVVGVIAMESLAIRMPWSAEIALTAAVFVGTGRLFRDQFLRLRLTRPQLITWGLLWLVSASINSRVDLNNTLLGDPFLFYVAAFSGIVVSFDLARRLGHSPVLETIGRQTMPIFCMHMLVFLVITALFKLIDFPIVLSYQRLLEVNPAFNPWLATAVYVLPGLAVPLGLVTLYNRYGRTLLKQDPPRTLVLRVEMR